MNPHQPAQPSAAAIDDAHRAPDRWLPRLLRVLDDQADLYTQLDNLGQQQSKQIADSDTNALLNTLARRQNVIDRIAERNTEVEPFAADWPALLSKLPDDERTTLRSRIDRLDNLVATIAARDEQDRLVLEQRRNKISSELNSVSKQRSAVNAYTKAPANNVPAPRYQDRQG